MKITIVQTTYNLLKNEDLIELEFLSYIFKYDDLCMQHCILYRMHKSASFIFHETAIFHDNTNDDAFLENGIGVKYESFRRLNATSNAPIYNDLYFILCALEKNFSSS